MVRYNGNYEIYVYIKYIIFFLFFFVLMILIKVYIIKLGEMYF